MPETIFDKILDGSIPSWKVWEDENHLAFLTPFGTVPGFTVLIPKKNPGDYVFDLPDETYQKLMQAAKTVAGILGKAFATDRVALVFEGTEVPYVHAKLIPIHNDYPGYINTKEGGKREDAELDAVQEQILKTQET